MKSAILAVRFASEIAAVVGIAWWDWPWSIGPAVVVIAVWGRWVAPRARRRLADPVRLVVELLIFVFAAAAYAAAGHGVVAVVFAAAAIATAFATRPLEA